jgi:hypothetical protein
MSVKLSLPKTSRMTSSYPICIYNFRLVLIPKDAKPKVISLLAYLTTTMQINVKYNKI